MARLLLPEEFGKIALVASLISIIQTIVQIGLTAWLVQAKEARQLDFSTNFFATISVSILLYVGVFIAAPLFAQYYNDIQIESILRVQGLGIILTSLTVVQISKLRRDLKFRNIFIVQVCATFIQGLTGVFLAINGFGVWALVYSNLSYLTTLFLGITYFTRELKFTEFSLKSLRTQFGFSFRILLNGISDSLLNLFVSTIIYKEFDANSLGFYNRGSLLPILVVSNIDGAINSVMFPIISRVYNESKEIKPIVRNSFLVSFYFVFPAMVGLAIVSRPLLIFLFSSKWEGSTVFMQIISLTVTTWIFSIFTNTVNAIGRSDLTFLSNIIVKVIAISVILITYKFGMIPFLIGMMFYSIVNCGIQSTLAHRIIRYSYREQIRDIFPMILNTFIMSIAVVGVMFFTDFSPNLVIIYVLIGIATYVAISIFMKIETFIFIKSIVFEYFESLFVKGV